MTPIVDTRIPKCTLGANLVILAQLHKKFSPKWSQDACLVEIWWFQPKSATCYREDKPNLYIFYMIFHVKLSGFRNSPFVPGRFILRYSDQICVSNFYHQSDWYYWLKPLVANHAIHALTLVRFSSCPRSVITGRWGGLDGCGWMGDDRKPSVNTMCCVL